MLRYPSKTFLNLSLIRYSYYSHTESTRSVFFALILFMYLIIEYKGLYLKTA